MWFYMFCSFFSNEELIFECFICTKLVLIRKKTPIVVFAPVAHKVVTKWLYIFARCQNISLEKRVLSVHFQRKCYIS